MIEHPAEDALLAFADGDRTASTFETVSAHVASCADCAKTVSELRAVSAWLASGARTHQPPAPVRDWPSLSARIEARRARGQHVFRWAAVAVAASVIVSTGLRQRTMDDPTIPQRDAAASLATAASELERFIAAGRSRIPSAEARALDDAVVAIDTAIHQTRSALENDPSNEFLLDHLGVLRRRRIAALQNFAEGIRRRS
jgi:anti-sigma factor ChrR (cupin superfamily)